MGCTTSDEENGVNVVICKDRVPTYPRIGEAFYLPYYCLTTRFSRMLLED